jgi:hypothetical protein
LIDLPPLSPQERHGRELFAALAEEMASYRDPFSGQQMVRATFDIWKEREVGIFLSDALIVNGKHIAMLVDGRLAVKLSWKRVAALILARVGDRLRHRDRPWWDIHNAMTPSDRFLKQDWLLVKTTAEAFWLELTHEAMAYQFVHHNRQLADTRVGRFAVNSLVEHAFTPNHIPWIKRW